MISLSPSTSSPMAGESVSLTCSVTLPGTVSGTPVFQWAGPGDTLTPAAPTTSGPVVNSTLTLRAVKTSQAGQYICTASVEGHNWTVSIAFRSVNITVQSKWKRAHRCVPNRGLRGIRRSMQLIQSTSEERPNLELRPGPAPLYGQPTQ